MIFTSNHNEFRTCAYTTYAISGNRGKDAGYQGASYPKLAPLFSFWKVWHDNIGKVPEEENNRYYVQEYWNQVLSKLDPKSVYDKLDNSILLCYESHTEFCHRHIVAAWLELFLGVNVPEVVLQDNRIKEVTRPEYIKQYLEDAMRNDRDIQGAISLEASCLFEKREKLEKEMGFREYNEEFDYQKKLIKGQKVEQENRDS